MAVIKCKMCGGDLVIEPGSTVAECEYCGSRQTVPVADNEKKLALFARANRLRAACEFDKAAGIYEAIVADFPEEAESYWGLVLCKYGIEYVDDPATGKKIPTCHRSSFDSVMDDSNFEQAMENADEVALRVYRQEAKQIEGIRKGILEVSSSEKPYDIFICYKETDSNGNRTVDSLLAQDIYDALTSKGYRVFFSRITLEDKLGQAYEPYIFAALNSAKIMLAVGTCYEHYNAVWVKNEWSRYLKIIAQDKNKYLIPCYKGLDAYDIPKEFAHLQGQDMGKVGAMQDLLRGIEKLMPKAEPAIPVVQEKVVVGNAGGSNKIASLLDRGNMALEDGDWAKADSFFEDVLNNDSRNAQAYIGKTLAQEKCQTMDALVRKRMDMYQNVAWTKLYIKENTAHIHKMAMKYTLCGYVEKYAIQNLYQFDLSYTSEVSGRQKQYHDEEIWWQNHRWLSRAEKFAEGEVAEYLQKEKQHLFMQLNNRIKKAQEADVQSIAKLESAYAAHISEADKRAEKMHDDGLVRREREYQGWLITIKKDPDISVLDQALTFFALQSGYKDCKELAEHCSKRISDIIAENERKKAQLRAEEAARRAAEEAEAKRLRLLAEEEAERQRILAEEEAERQRILAKEASERQRMLEKKKREAQKKRKKIIAIIVLVCIVLAVAVTLVVTKVIIPGKYYEAALVLEESGQYEDAAQLAMAFGKAGNYKDARERSFALWDDIAVRDIISTGFSHTIGIHTDGTAVSTVYNGEPEYNFGQCDVSDWMDIVAVSAGNTHSVGLKADGTVVTTKYSGDSEFNFGQCNVTGWTDIVAIGTNSGATFGLKSDGTVVAKGYNEYGQCNVSGWTDIIAISGITLHSVGLRRDGTVVAAGDNEYGQCDVSDWTDIVAISAGAFHTVGLKADGTVVAVGRNRFGQCDVAQWSDIVAISAGTTHTVGLKADGTVVAVGSDGDGQCDVSDWKDIVAIYAGSYRTVGLKADGTVIAAGWNDDNACEVSHWKNIKLS